MALGLILLPACASEGATPLCVDEPTAVDCRGPGDAGLDPGLDGGSQDASPVGFTDGGSPAGDGGGLPNEDTELTAGGADACFNGLDDDGNSALDCGESDCGANAYCCVGAARAACCVTPGVDFMTDFAACAGPGPTDCGAEPFTAFGSPEPRLDGLGFVPNGDDLGDSGLILGPALDTRQERVTLSAVIGASLEPCAGPRCLDVVAFGLAERPTMAPHVVRPEVAVYVRPSRGDYALVVGGQVVQATDLTTDAPREYSLSVAPDGAVSLIVAGEPVAMAARVTPRGGLTPMIWGRTFELMAPEVPAYVTTVALETRGCDMPDGLTRDDAPTVPFGGPTWSSQVASPSVVADGGQMLMAFVYQGGVHLARHDGTSWQLAGSGALSSPALVPAANEALEDPELVRRADRYDLYLTLRRADGTRTIVLARGGVGHTETFGPPTELTLPSGVELRAPSVLDDGGVIYLAAVTERSARSVIALLTATDVSGPFDYVNGTLDSAVIVEPGADLTHFAMDEVDAPELFRGGRGLIRLYYAGRRGTRWAIGAQVSGGVLDTWRAPDRGDAILTGSGQGFDALVVRDPSVVLSDGRLQLFYSASDGVRTVVGRAQGRTP